MTNDQEPESFSLALREAAYDFEPPHHERFHAQAVERTRQIRRRRSAGGALAGVVAVGVAGALAVTVSGRPAGGVSAASDTPGHAAAAASPADSPPRPTSAGSDSDSDFGSANADGVTQGEVLTAFYAAMPSGSDVSQTQDPETGVIAPGATAPVVNSLSGDWYVSINASLRDSGGSGYSLVEVAVTRGVDIDDCTKAEHGSTTDTCTVSSLDSGTLILDESRQNPADTTSAPIWSYHWDSPTGYEVDLTISAGTVSRFALTQQQVSAILTRSAWAQLAEALPVPICVGGTLSNTYPGSGSTSDGIGKLQVQCSTNGEFFPLN
jgi:hypothetical protein